jgi:2-oxoglutarate dehydrogenase E2 component (dihydrolipoamide succinyltransferase)
MPTEIRVPTLGESVTEATIGQWFKKEGDAVAADEPLVEIETDKVTIEVPAPSAGVLSAIKVKTGDTVEVGTLLGSIADGAAAKAKVNGGKAAEAKPALKPAPAPKAEAKPAAKPAATAPAAAQVVPPSVRRIAEENNLDTAAIRGTGKDGRPTKADAIAALAKIAEAPRPAPAAKAPEAPRPQAAREERVRMTRLRQTIATRLKEAQETAAMLTTFNEVDMSAVIEARAKYKDLFEKRHQVKLGFMGFFVKACIVGLKDIPAVNAEIDGTDIIYKNHYDIGVAVGTERGLVVPVVRDADVKSLAEIEHDIADFGARARDGSLKLEDLQGGTFTISNGGVYGSLMSTPILNAPQSGILGMHKIEERPIAVKGQVVIRPMMYVALSYDHRIVDGREAVTFLVRVKECLEAPERMLLDI